MMPLVAIRAVGGIEWAEPNPCLTNKSRGRSAGFRFWFGVLFKHENTGSGHFRITNEVAKIVLMIKISTFKLKRTGSLVHYNYIQILSFAVFEKDCAGVVGQHC